MRWRASIRLLAAILVVLLAGCEQSRMRQREKVHADRLQLEMTKLHAEISGWKSPQGISGGKQYDKIIPEWKTYNDDLAKCRQLLDQVLAKMAAKQYTEVTPLAVEGIQAAQKIEVTAEEHSRGVRKRAEEEGALFPEFFDLEYTAMQANAVLYATYFLQPLTVLLQHAPQAERRAVAERIAQLYQEAKLPSLSLFVGKSLQKAWAEEDDPGNKAQLEQALKQLNLPLSTPAAPAAGAK